MDDASGLLLRDFYMDDGLRSLPTAQQALQFNKDSQAILLPIFLQFSGFFQGPKIYEINIHEMDIHINQTWN